MAESVKSCLTLDEQVQLLHDRGMDVGDRDAAVELLRRTNYYRLSGYWYGFRHVVGSGRGDMFYRGSRLVDVIALAEFDARLRAATFSTLAPVELAVRASLGHALGQIDPCSHLDAALLGPRARQGTTYPAWLAGYDRQLASSREDFVTHHRTKYGGRLPVWAAVEVMDWGQLTYLFGFSPDHVRDEVAGACGLRAPQLESWLKALNVVRNICAHHGRLFNRVHTLQPKLPRRRPPP